MEDPEAIARAVHWVLGRPGVFLNSVGDVHLLPLVLDAADKFSVPPTEEEMHTQVTQLGMRPLF